MAIAIASSLPLAVNIDSASLHESQLGGETLAGSSARSRTAESCDVTSDAASWNASLLGCTGPAGWLLATNTHTEKFLVHLRCMTLCETDPYWLI
jgi:hypothetical protein